MVSSARDVPDLSNKTWRRDPSKLLKHLAGAAECRDAAGLAAWLRSVGWAAVDANCRRCEPAAGPRHPPQPGMDGGPGLVLARPRAALLAGRPVRALFTGRGT